MCYFICVTASVCGCGCVLQRCVSSLCCILLREVKKRCVKNVFVCVANLCCRFVKEV